MEAGQNNILWINWNYLDILRNKSSWGWTQNVRGVHPTKPNKIGTDHPGHVLDEKNLDFPHTGREDAAWKHSTEQVYRCPTMENAQIIALVDGPLMVVNQTTVHQNSADLPVDIACGCHLTIARCIDKN